MGDIYSRRFKSLQVGKDNISPNCTIGDNVRIGLSIVEDDVVIGNNVFIGNFTMIRSGVTIGDDSIIGHLVMIEADAKIGSRVTIQSQCHITKYATIEDRVFLGPAAVCINTQQISHGRSFAPKLEGPHIKFGARIGTASLVMPGRMIGENAVLGAKSLATKDIPDREVWIGHPAEFVRMVTAAEVLKK